MLQSFEKYSALAGLWPLVKKQRTLAGKIAPLAPLVDEEKTIRKAIDELLVGVGFASNEGVLCRGYAVLHHVRKGNTTLNAEAAAILFTLGGVDPEFVDFVLTTCLETGEPAKWATVDPSKGAKVRA